MHGVNTGLSEINIYVQNMGQPLLHIYIIYM